MHIIQGVLGCSNFFFFLPIIKLSAMQIFFFLLILRKLLWRLLNDGQDPAKIRKSGPKAHGLHPQPIIFSQNHMAVVQNPAEPFLQFPVLDHQPIHLVSQIFQMPLLPPPRSPGRLPVWYHPPQLPLVVIGRTSCRGSHRTLRIGTGTWGPVVG